MKSLEASGVLSEPPPHEHRLVLRVSPFGRSLVVTTAPPTGKPEWQSLDTRLWEINDQPVHVRISRAQQQGHEIYKCRYGTDHTEYCAPPALVDEWCVVQWKKWVSRYCVEWVARNILSSYTRHGDRPQIVVDDVVLRLVRMQGLRYFIKRASQGDWLVGGRTKDKKWKLGWDELAAEQFGIPYAMMQHYPSYATNWLDDSVTLPKGERIHSTWCHPDGRLFVLTRTQRWVATPWRATLSGARPMEPCNITYSEREAALSTLRSVAPGEQPASFWLYSDGHLYAHTTSHMQYDLGYREAPSQAGKSKHLLDEDIDARSHNKMRKLTRFMATTPGPRRSHRAMIKPAYGIRDSGTTRNRPS